MQTEQDRTVTLGPIYDAISRLQKMHGKVTAEIVVNAARSKTSPLHSHFTWDNDAAAHKHRLNEARWLIARVKVVYREEKESAPVSVRVFHCVERDDNGVAPGAYQPINEIVKKEPWRESLLLNALRDAKTFTSKYAALRQYSDELAQALDALELFAG